MTYRKYVRVQNAQEANRVKKSRKRERLERRIFTIVAWKFHFSFPGAEFLTSRGNNRDANVEVNRGEKRKKMEKK